MFVFAAVLGLTVSGFSEEEFSGNNKGIDKGGIRVGLRVSPGIDEVEFEQGGTTHTFSIDADTGGQVDVMYVKRFMGREGQNTVGGVFGGGLYFGNQSGEDADAKVELSTIGIIGQAGVAWNIGDAVVIEVTPFLGVGISSVDLTDKTGVFVFDSGSGAQVTAGIKGGVFIPLGSNFELGVEGGYVAHSTATTIEFPSPIPAVDAMFSGDGFQAGLVLGVKF